MIGTMKEHDGHWSLAVHLGRLDDNETVRFHTEGVSASTIADAISEMMLMASGCQTAKPLIHAMASPSISYTDADWLLYWDVFEAEFGLHGHPHVEVRHRKFGKGGRTAEHAHRVYLRLDVSGRAVRTSYSAIRLQKVNRIAEWQAGERFTPGKFNRLIVERLRASGLHDVADAMVRAGLDENQPNSALSSSERAMTERLADIATDEVWRRVAAAWRRSDSGTAFKAALAESGLRLAIGTKVPVVVTPNGAVHPLLRAINNGGQRQSGSAIRKSELADRIKGIELPVVADLGPVPRGEAGVFAITNLDHLPVSVALAKADIEPEAPDAAFSSPPVRLTLEQEEALLEFEDALHSTASAQAKAIRERIEAEVIAEVRQRRYDALKRRIEEERASWDLPGIGSRDWRDKYRADLAGLPKEYGPHLRWVERLDAERRRVVLKTGATVMLEPDRTWTKDSSRQGIMAVMIAHAQERGWRAITITGNREWRVAMAKAATRAGLGITDSDLVTIAQAEKSRMANEQLIASWWRARDRFLNAPPGRRSAEQAAMIAVLEQIERRPQILDFIVDDEQRRLLAFDIESRYRTIRLDHSDAEGSLQQGLGRGGGN